MESKIYHLQVPEPAGGPPQEEEGVSSQSNNSSARSGVRRQVTQTKLCLVSPGRVMPRRRFAPSRVTVRNADGMVRTLRSTTTFLWPTHTHSTSPTTVQIILWYARRALLPTPLVLLHQLLRSRIKFWLARARRQWYWKIRVHNLLR